MAGQEVSGPPNEWAFYEVRPHRFAPVDSVGAVEILTELVNLPDDADSRQVKEFIDRFHNLNLGPTSSDDLPSERMEAEEVIHLRGLYRAFWEVSDGDFKSKIFMDLLGKWFRAYSLPRVFSAISPQENDVYPLRHFATGALQERKQPRYPLRDFDNSALQMNWKSGKFKIVARGPIDFLTHAVFQNRNRLRACSGEKCGKLFVASGPHEKHCSTTCKLEAGRKRKREWWKNRPKTKKGERR